MIDLCFRLGLYRVSTLSVGGAAAVAELADALGPSRDGCSDDVEDAALSEEGASLASAAARPLDMEPPPPNNAAEDEVMAQLGVPPADMIAGSARPYLLFLAKELIA